MIKKLIFSFITASIFMIAGYTSSMALGFGAYFNGGGGHTTWSDFSMEGEQYFIGGGLLLDTCVAKNRVFNYRLNVGYDRNLPLELNKTSFRSLKINFHRLNLINTFGFGIVRHSIVRFWLGPQLCVRYLNIDMKGTDYILPILLRVPFPIEFHSIKDRAEVDVGAALGLNFHLSALVSLTLEGGFRYGVIFNSSQSQQSGSSATVNLGGDETYEGYGSVGVIFRFNDEYGV
jgi:hypothetical protein